MQVFVLEKRIVLSGKAWEIQYKLKQASKQYTYINDWITSVHRDSSQR